MKTITLLLLAALSAQLPGSDAISAKKAPACAGQKGPPHPTAEDGSYSLLTSQRPAI